MQPSYPVMTRVKWRGKKMRWDTLGFIWPLSCSIHHTWLRFWLRFCLHSLKSYSYTSGNGTNLYHLLASLIFILFDYIMPRILLSFTGIYMNLSCLFENSLNSSMSRGICSHLTFIALIASIAHLSSSLIRLGVAFKVDRNQLAVKWLDGVS